MGCRLCNAFGEELVTITKFDQDHLDKAFLEWLNVLPTLPIGNKEEIKVLLEAHCWEMFITLNSELARRKAAKQEKGLPSFDENNPTAKFSKRLYDFVEANATPEELLGRTEVPDFDDYHPGACVLMRYCLNYQVTEELEREE
jgi:hypothetical protein